MRFEPMRRRSFIALLGGAAAWPLCARAQQGKPVIGLLRNASADSSVELIAALRDGLKHTGYVEGQNIAIEYRWPERQDEVPGMAADLVRRPCAVIVAGGNADCANRPLHISARSNRVARSWLRRACGCTRWCLAEHTGTYD